MAIHMANVWQLERALIFPPYNYNTVLMVYKRNTIKPKTYFPKMWMPQVNKQPLHTSWARNSGDFSQYIKSPRSIMSNLPQQTMLRLSICKHIFSFTAEVTYVYERKGWVFLKTDRQTELPPTVAKTPLPFTKEIVRKGLRDCYVKNIGNYVSWLRPPEENVPAVSNWIWIFSNNLSSTYELPLWTKPWEAVLKMSLRRKEFTKQREKERTTKGVWHLLPRLLSGFLMSAGWPLHPLPWDGSRRYKQGQNLKLFKLVSACCNQNLLW